MVSVGIGDSLYVREEGTGPPVLFLHALGASSRYWYGRLGTLPAVARCLLPDLLGFGRSPKPDVRYTMDDHLGMIRGALRARGASETPHVIVGHSLGAILAIEYAARFPAEVRGLVLLSLPYYRSAAEARAFIGAHGSWMARLTVANGTGAHAIHIAHMAVQPLLMSFAALFAAVTRVVPPAVAVDSLEHTWASYSRTLDRCILNHNLSPALATLTAVPILALHGTRDLSASLAAVHALATRMPNVVVQPLVCAHHPFIERHDACLDAILRFTKDLIAIPPVAP